jgi:diguanylate cyclase (GGDEF)-like protein
LPRDADTRSGIATPRNVFAPSLITALLRILATRLPHGWWGLLAALLMTAGPVLAQAASDAIVLPAAGSRLGITSGYLLLEDPTHQLDLAHVLAPATHWTPSDGGAFNLGHSHSAWWLKLRLVNTQAANATRLLELQNPRLDEIRLQVMRAGQVAESWHTGDRLPFATRAVPYHGFAFALTLSPGETVDVLVRLDSKDGYFGLLPMSLVDEHGFQQEVQRHTLMCGLYYGALLILLAYHLCLLGSTRDASFVWYVGYLACLFATRFAFEGHASQYLDALPPDWINQGLLLSYSMSCVLFGAMLLVNLRSQLAPRPRLLWLCRAVVALNALPLPMALAGSYSGTLKLAMPATILSVIFAMSISVWAWRSGLRHTRYFLAGSGCMLLGLLAERLRLESTLPDHPLFAYGVAIGSVLEALFIGLALADGVNRIKAEKLQAEREAREAQSQLNGQLGHLVQERTLELEAANQRLTALAITDALTGAFNRRHFQDQLGYRLAQARRSGEPLGLCLFDLDHFKGYNDRFGHPAGDEVLRRVSAAVNQRLKRSVDRLFRIGGEEFAVLFAAPDMAQVRGFVEELRGGIEALGIAHESNEAGVVTASFGLAWCGQAALAETDEQALYRAADELLYRAKGTGRNRVDCAEIAATKPAAKRA